MSEDAKWECEYCTYENFPSSLKCTMCRGSKPLLNEDIFRLRADSPNSREDMVRTSTGGGKLIIFFISFHNFCFDIKYMAGLITWLNQIGNKANSIFKKLVANHIN